MTDVTARPARDVAEDTFADLLPNVLVSGIYWEAGGQLRVSFAADLTDNQITMVKRRMCSSGASEEQLREQAETFVSADPASVSLVNLTKAVQRLARLVIAMRDRP